MLEAIDITDKNELFAGNMLAFVTVHHHAGLAFLMLRRYKDAARILNEVGRFLRLDAGCSLSGRVWFRAGRVSSPSLSLRESGQVLKKNKFVFPLVERRHPYCRNPPHPRPLLFFRSSFEAKVHHDEWADGDDDGLIPPLYEEPRATRTPWS